MEIDDYLAHIGVARKSGRYPWGSGKNPHQNSKDFLAYVGELRDKGLTETEIAKGMGITTTQLRAANSIAKNAQRKADASQAYRLKETGMSNVAIGKEMGINESSVRALLDPAAQSRNDVLTTTASMLKDQVNEKGYIDIGTGVENNIGVSTDKLRTAVAILEEEGYVVHTVNVEQLGTGKMTKVKVLAPPGTTYGDVVKNPDQIKMISEYSEDGGRNYNPIETPRSVDSSRIEIRYAEEGGADADGVIYLRPGVDDISLGGARYAQVRVAVDDTHFLKGMAMYKDDLPPGVDVVFNTNKSDTGNKLDAMKALTGDEDSPFGAVIRQRKYPDENGEMQLSTMNIVNEEGNWNKWSNNLSSQMLSKQSPQLAAEQLGLKLALKQAEFDEINSLTNPAVKRKLLDGFAEDADSASVHLKGAALPRQRTQVILPINSLKDSEVYAPNFRNGEKVVLVRYPHGGKFEIPELTVNNRNKEAKSSLGNALDAVGINSKVASRLSGADFDGDTVIVIPNNNRKVVSESPLVKLKDFDPQTAYPRYDGMKLMSPRTKQLKMGDVSNLITDMTIRGANHDELARAVKHSMVVIDAEKHKLNWKQSAIDNGIAQLKTKYQGSSRAGASTLISKASSTVRVDERRPRSAANGGPIDKATGRLMYEPTGVSYQNKAGKTVTKTTKSTRMAEVDDAFKLASGTPIEAVYARHANDLKALANKARRVSVNTKSTPYSPSAKATYRKEVDTLVADLNVALMNKPRERQAQLLANTTVAAKRAATPDMEASEIKKIKGVALTDARNRVGAEKTLINITPRQWDAIQAGAVSNNRLTQILNNADLDVVKQLATPRSTSSVSPALLAKAKAMQAGGYTQAEVADALGIATSTLTDALANGG